MKLCKSTRDFLRHLFKINWSFYDNVIADASTSLRRGLTRQWLVFRSQLLQAIWNWNFHQWFILIKVERFSIFQVGQLSAMYFMCWPVNYKKKSVLGSTSGIDFKFGPNMPHEKVIDCHHLVVHINRKYFTYQNKLHPSRVIKPNVVPIVSTPDDKTLVQILGK